MSDAVAIAFIGLVGTIITTMGALWLKRKFDLSDKRESEREEEEKRCERIKQVWGEAMYAARHRQQQLHSLALLVDKNPDYVLARIQEIAAEPTDIERWEKYVDGVQ